MIDKPTARDAIAELAKHLGLRVIVTNDVVTRETRVEATLRPLPGASVTLDDEMLHLEPAHISDLLRRELLRRELLDLQAAVFDNAVKFLTDNDARGRTYRISKADKNTLYEMTRDAIDQLPRRFSYADEHQGKVDEKRQAYEALARKLIR